MRTVLDDNLPKLSDRSRLFLI